MVVGSDETGGFKKRMARLLASLGKAFADLPRDSLQDAASMTAFARRRRNA